MSLGRTIKNLRIEKRWKMRELSEKSQVSKGRLSEIEAGIRTNVTLDILDRLAVAFGISVYQLIAIAEMEKDLEDEKTRLYREVKPYFEKFEESLKEVYKKN